jgi:hypothetical protein
MAAKITKKQRAAHRRAERAAALRRAYANTAGAKAEAAERRQLRREERARQALRRELAQDKLSLRKLCAPLPRGYQGVFTALGVLPHGMPLFADGSTQCAICERVIRWSHLAFGACVDCRTVAMPSVFALVRALRRLAPPPPPP